MDDIYRPNVLLKPKYAMPVKRKDQQLILMWVISGKITYHNIVIAEVKNSLQKIESYLTSIVESHVNKEKSFDLKLIEKIEKLATH